VSVKTIAWMSSVLLAATLTVAVGGFAFLIAEQRELVRAFRADEVLMTSVELIALEAVESGDLPKANVTMIQRVFVGLTRLQPNREQLSRRQREDVDSLVRRLAAYRERNPEGFSSQEAWWIERLDGWVAALPAE
jgi:hypothetical protein